MSKLSWRFAANVSPADNPDYGVRIDHYKHQNGSDVYRVTVTRLSAPLKSFWAVHGSSEIPSAVERIIEEDKCLVRTLMR